MERLVIYKIDKCKDCHYYESQRDYAAQYKDLKVFCKKLKRSLGPIVLLNSIPMDCPLYPVNQCDGCKRGLPIVNGLHKELTGRPYMCCTKDRY